MFDTYVVIVCNTVFEIIYFLKLNMSETNIDKIDLILLTMLV